jgi:hypothetical protein
MESRLSLHSRQLFTPRQLMACTIDPSEFQITDTMIAYPDLILETPLPLADLRS